MLRLCWERIFIFLLLSFLAAVGNAATVKVAKVRPSWRTNFEIFGSTTLQAPSDTAINSTNRNLEIPASISTAEVRPDFLWKYGDSVKVIVRSRLLGDVTLIKLTTPTESRWGSKGRVDVSDAYLDWKQSEVLSYAIGLQNYQWGPCELYSPSNPFFHFNSQQKSFFYKEKGKGLIRLNATPNSRWNYVGIIEAVNNNERYWIEDRDFNVKTMLKIERQFQDKANYIGFGGGTGEKMLPFVSEYINFSPKDGISLYFDARHTQGRTNYMPQENFFGSYDLLDPDGKSGELFTLALMGARWEGTLDLRLEYVYNSAGFTSSEYSQARTGFNSFSALTNIRRLARPGLEFLSQQYLYFSLRAPDLGKKKDLNLYTRYLHTLLDSSGVLQLDADKVWSDAVVIYGEILIFTGGKDTEFHFTNDYQVSAGFKYSI